ncbi:hypothetical protein BGZ51_003784 [Haplosporangium sp. Z 767]|nr:hypothetical protein BGZ51_003784 [Haplosporangium sp. Z 767]KAF9193774.1 hypothetical protein BGZ50_007067 [Haplosporangium sp. Z 11]
MESSFWNKLKKTIIPVPRDQPSDALQLSRFNKCWLGVQAALSTPEKRNVAIQATDIPARLKIMVDLLVDEESRLEDATGSTGVCMEHLLKNNVLGKLVNTCTEGDRPRGIIGETIRTMASMINLLDDQFLVHNAVHRPTVKLLRICCSPGTELEDTESYHEDLVDLMYILCSKIHGYPELLNIFFYDKQWLTVPERVSAKRLQKNQETMALLKSLSQQSGLGLENLDIDLPISTTRTSTAIEENVSPTVDSKEKRTRARNVTNNDQSTTLQDEDDGKRDYEFLLFTYLSKFVHREGKAGDFARTGLLFLMELATGSLGEYILDSEFATYLTAGVGALYSQLPRKLIVNSVLSCPIASGSTDSNLSISEAKSSRRPNIEYSTSTDFQSRLDAFLKVLEFCQDVLMRCPNTEIATILLASFKTIFLENILYPSILECSDIDGSSVAVISYIDQILQVLEHQALVDLVVGFLMASEEDDARPKAVENMDAFVEVQNPQMTSLYFMATGRFTLKDLVLSRLKSRSQSTVIATLKLLNTIITRHCRYSLKLLSTQPYHQVISNDKPSNDSLRALYGNVPRINHHVHELDLFLGLISTINPQNSPEIICGGYESYLRDAEVLVETHQCVTQCQDSGNQQKNTETISDAERKKQRRRSMKYGQRLDQPDNQASDGVAKDQGQNLDIAVAASNCCSSSSSSGYTPSVHQMHPSDPLLQTLLGTLSHFFAHTVELNLALTGVITSLAICPHRSLEGWLLFKSSDVRKPDMDRGSDEDSETDSSHRIISGLQVSAYFDPTQQSEVADDSDDEDTFPFYLSQEPGKAGSDAISPSGPPSFKSFPPFFTMLRTLTQQVDYYRSEIDGFDEFLAERRRNLLVATEHIPALRVQPSIASNTLSSTNLFDSSDSFQSSNMDFMGNTRSSTPLVSSSSSPNLLGPSSSSGANSRAESPASQGSKPKTSVLSSSANPVSMVKINSPRPRKSSSPSSLMSTPSNMSFLIPPGVGGKRNFRSNSISPLAGTGAQAPRYPTASAAPSSTQDSDGQASASPTPQTPPRTLTTSPTPVSQSRSQWLSSTTVGGMVSSATSSSATTTLTGQGSKHGYSNSGAYNQSVFASPSHPQLQLQQGSNSTSPLVKMMETMMVKPLFSDGFVNDSDNEAETGLDIEAESSGDDDDEVSESDSQSSGNGNDDHQSDDDEDKEVETSAQKGNVDPQEPFKPANVLNRARKQGHHRSETTATTSTANQSNTSTSNSASGVSGGGGSNNKAGYKKKRGPTPLPAQEKLVTLAQLLTNVVILEEVVKEVVATAQVRKGRGVDIVRFL